MEDPTTLGFDGGTVLLGGSPLRLFRLSARAREIATRWRSGAPVGPSRAAQLLARRLVSSGAFVPRPAAPTFGPDDVTVVVPVRDRPAQLDRLLGALHGLACIVVDDASADAGESKEIAERHGARFVGLASNVGPAGARNAGVERVHSALVAFVDSDCVPSEGWLGPLLGHFDDPLVAAVAPRIRPSAVRRASAARPLRGGTFVARPGPSGGSRTAGQPHPVRAERGARRTGRRGDGPRALRCHPAGWRGRGPRVAPRRGGMGRPLRAGEHRRARRAAGTRILLGAPCFLRDDGRTPGPTPHRLAGARPCLGMVAGGVDAGAGPTTPPRARNAGGVHRHPGPAPGGTRAGSRRGGDPHRRRRHRRVPRCRRSPA